MLILFVEDLDGTNNCTSWDIDTGYAFEEIKNTIIRTNGQGQVIKIKDVAKVNDRREEMTILSLN